jgi:hypothetical protein
VAEDGTLEELVEDGMLEELGAEQGAAVVEAGVLLLLDWIEDLQLDLIPQQQPFVKEASEATLLLELALDGKGFEFYFAFYHNLYRDTGW